jgi:hypothetical protein
LIERGADKNARSNPAPRGRGPALGKSNDPRKAVAAQAAAVAARQASPSLGELRAVETGNPAAAGNAAAGNAAAGNAAAGNAAAGGGRGGRGGAAGGRAGGAGGRGAGDAPADDAD